MSIRKPHRPILFQFFAGLIFGGLIASLGFLLFKVAIKQLLPLHLLITTLLATIFILILLSFLIFHPKFSPLIKIFATIFTLILLLSTTLAWQKYHSFVNFSEQIQVKDAKQLESYYLYVKKTSTYQKISDLSSQTLGIYLETQAKNYQAALEKLTAIISLNSQVFPDSNQTYQALLNQSVSAILLSPLQKNLLEETASDFHDQVRLLYQIDFIVEQQPITQQLDAAKPFNIFISGIDVSGPISTVSRSDVNMIATVNPKTKRILLTSIPRDFYVQLSGTTGYRDKLTHAGVYGINTSIQTLENLFHTKIHYFARVNFDSLVQLVDLIGGIDIVSDATFTKRHGHTRCYYYAGHNHLDGNCALGYSRERFHYASGDRHRVRNQQDVLEAIVKKAFSSKKLLEDSAAIFDATKDSLQTNFPTTQIFKLVNQQLDNMSSWQIEKYSVNAMEFTHSYPHQRLYVMIPFQDTVDTATAKINQLLKD
ncbi:MAG: LCP family protein [Candidatus Saccharibacteria bacterium]|nr:LCP family protein [Candidatus Saccharibacteria bacterium]